MTGFWGIRTITYSRPSAIRCRISRGHIVAMGFAASRIGVELDNYYYSAKAHLTLAAELPDATFVDATSLVNWQRAVKSRGRNRVHA